MICPSCGKWNSIDARYCQYCGSSLKPTSFRINNFLRDNFQLFVIFGVFGGLSVYLSSFLNDINKTPELSQKIIVKLGSLEINYLAYGIGCSLLIMILISIVIIFKAYYVPKDRIPLIYITGWGAIERFAFTIPFIILIIGIIGYIINFYYDEISLVFSPIFYVLGIVSFFIFLTFIKSRYHMTGKILLLSTIGLWIIAGIVAAFSILIKNSAIFSIPLYSFASGIGGGVIPGIMVSIVIWVDEWKKSKIKAEIDHS